MVAKSSLCVRLGPDPDRIDRGDHGAEAAVSGLGHAAPGLFGAVA